MEIARIFTIWSDLRFNRIPDKAAIVWPPFVHPRSLSSRHLSFRLTSIGVASAIIMDKSRTAVNVVSLIRPCRFWLLLYSRFHSTIYSSSCLSFANYWKISLACLYFFLNREVGIVTLLFDTIPINFYTRVALCLTIYGVSINIEHFHVDVVAVVFFFWKPGSGNRSSRRDNFERLQFRG